MLSLLVFDILMHLFLFRKLVVEVLISHRVRKGGKGMIKALKWKRILMENWKTFPKIVKMMRKKSKSQNYLPIHLLQ